VSGGDYVGEHFVRCSFAGRMNDIDDDVDGKFVTCDGDESPACLPRHSGPIPFTHSRHTSQPTKLHVLAKSKPRAQTTPQKKAHSPEFEMEEAMAHASSTEHVEQLLSGLCVPHLRSLPSEKKFLMTLVFGRQCNLSTDNAMFLTFFFCLMS